MEKNQEDLLAMKIHGLLFSESDTDSDGLEDFDSFHEQYKPPPLPLEVIQQNLVVVSPKVIENVWMKRMQEQSKESEDVSVVEDPEFPPLFHHTSVCAPNIENNPDANVQKVTNQKLEVGESSSLNISSNSVNYISPLKLIETIQSQESANENEKNCPKKKKKKSNKRKKIINANMVDTIHHHGENFRKSDYELENVENTSPVMNLNGASNKHVISSLVNCGANEGEINQREKETDFDTLEFESQRSINIGNVKEQVQSSFWKIIPYVNENVKQITEVTSEGNISGKELFATTPKFFNIKCVDIEKLKNKNPHNQNESTEQQIPPNQGKKKKKKKKSCKSNNILDGIFSNYTSKIEVTRTEQIPFKNSNARDVTTIETKLNGSQISRGNDIEGAVEMLNYSPNTSLKICPEQENVRSISFFESNYDQNIIKPDCATTISETKTDCNDALSMVSYARKKNNKTKKTLGLEKIETDEHYNPGIKNHVLNSATHGEICRENLECTNKETNEELVSFPLNIAIEKKKKKRKKKTTPKLENTVLGCAGFATFSDNIKEYEDDLDENPATSIRSINRSDSVKNTNEITGISNDKETSKDIVPYYGRTYYTPKSLLVDSNLIYRCGDDINDQNILTEFDYFREIDNDYSSSCINGEENVDSRRQRSVLLQPYEFNSDTHLNKMVTFELKDNPKLTEVRMCYFLHNDPENEIGTLSEINDTQFLQNSINPAQTNYTQFRKNYNQIELSSDRSKFENKLSFRLQTEISKVPSPFITIIHLLFFFMFYNLMISFANWVFDNFMSIILLFIYISYCTFFQKF